MLFRSVFIFSEQTCLSNFTFSTKVFVTVFFSLGPKYTSQKDTNADASSYADGVLSIVAF